MSRDYVDEILQLWNKEIGNKFPMRKQLLLQNTFENVNVFLEGSWIALEEKTGKVVGCIVSRVWKENLDCIKENKSIGHIHFLLIDSEYRKKGIRTQILLKTEDALKEKEIKTIILGQDPWHYFPGISLEFKETQEWFKKKDI